MAHHMFWTLKWRKTKGSAGEADSSPNDGTLLTAETGSELLGTSRRKKLLEHIWQRTSLSRAQFDRLYLSPLQRYAELVQQLPASENHHHAYRGGMLDHGLEIVAYALKMRQSLLLPLGTSPETQAAQTEAWTTAIAYAALLHDIGKIAVDLQVDLESGKRWYPWDGPISGRYRFRFAKGRDYKLHGAAAGLIYHQVLPSAAMSWLSEFPDLWASLLFVLAGQYEHAGILGELVIQADQASVAQELGGNPARAISAPRSSLQRQLLEGLRFLVREQLKLNQPEASDGWLTQDALWLVSKTVADKLRAHLLAQGTEGIPSSNSTLFNVLQDHGIIQENPDKKAIWKAAVDSGSWQVTLTFLKVSPALVWEVSERPACFTGSVTPESEAQAPADDTTGTENPTVPEPLAPTASEPQLRPVSPSEEDDIDTLLALFESETPASIPDSPTSEKQPVRACENLQEVSDTQVGSVCNSIHPLHKNDGEYTLGAMFLTWLREGIVNHKIVINDARAKIHTVAGTVFVVTPEIFQRYAQEHPHLQTIAKSENTADWRLVQRAFEKEGHHHKRENGLNIWTCEVNGPRKTRTVKGYLLKDPLLLFAERPYDNPYLKLIDS
jgi:integrating conjugative element relaxase (TIGR03760 family)